MLRIKKKGQSSLEYATLIIVVIGVLLTMGVYFKRGIQGRWKASADGLGEQYDPRYTISNTVHTIESNTETSLFIVPVDPLNPNDTFATHRVDTTSATETRVGNTIVAGY
ncbi:MAG: hypothetical protein P9X22_09295 [Candidatus Zapsychrus exili]|nr:hypothetical protein [Candidatus Zapsychrus exili]